MAGAEWAGTVKAGLIRTSEYAKYYDQISQVSCNWWALTDAGKHAVIIGSCVLVGERELPGMVCAVRPVLRAGKGRRNRFKKGAKLVYKNLIWTALSSDLALCDACINTCAWGNAEKTIDTWTDVE